ncbi:aminoacyltransferase [Streptococcus sp. DD13]|uniref:aminoacyltransferase n=1 Tax=Streptococcus sp. DD13 TaxID=1777881 RepID=UPI0007943392|nr:aminoacyltransferase [Streptococcus sp. DD13]KXT78301.1 tRNA-dependent lipid II-Ala--L-alanine ligase [Streptococcus sp. DD13]
MALEELGLEEYQAFYQEVKKASFMQDPKMAVLLEKRGYQVYYLGKRVDGKLVVATIAYTKPMFGGLYMEINSGPISMEGVQLTDFYQELRGFAKKKGVLELLLKPYDSYQVFDSKGEAISEPREDAIQGLRELGYHFDGLQTGYPGGEPDWLYVKDMEKVTQADLTKSFSSKGRQLVKKAHSFGIHLRALTREELSIFKEITEKTSSRRSFSDKPLDYYQDLYDSFGSDAEFMIATLNFTEYEHQLQEELKKVADDLSQVQKMLMESPDSAKQKRRLQELERQKGTIDQRISEAEELKEQYGEEDVVLAGSLFLYTSHETVYLFSGSYTEFNRFYAPVLLQEYAMQETLRRDLPLYNFLGIQGIFDGSDGVLRFKQNFNGFIERKMGTFRYYPSPGKYKLIQWLKKITRRG